MTKSASSSFPAVLYDHLIRLTADAPNRLHDLREGRLGVFGGVQKRTCLFVRPRASPLVTNVTLGAFSPGSHISAAECFLGFEPRTESAWGYDETRRFATSLASTMKWEVVFGHQSHLLRPTYCFSAPFAIAPRAEKVDITIPPGESANVICTINDDALVATLNTGRFCETQFDTRIVRVALMVSALAAKPEPEPPEPTA